MVHGRARVSCSGLRPEDFELVDMVNQALKLRLTGLAETDPSTPSTSSFYTLLSDWLLRIDEPFRGYP